MRLYIFILLDTAFGWQTLPSPEQLKTANILPWIGVLKVRSGNTEFATGLTLIAERLAAGSANDISKLDKKTLRITSKAIFFKHNIPWHCDVIDYQIHPDFNNNTLLNTLAILNLDCDRQICYSWVCLYPNTNFKPFLHIPGTPINWSTDKRFWKNIYAIGLSDRNYDFEQIIIKMKFVKSSKCLDFYINEEIDFKLLWPKHFLCFKALNNKRNCVFDSGMALVARNNGNWTLIGISILGPGCGLPSRYIDIYPYMNWMIEQTNKHKIGYRRQLDDENSEKNYTVTAIDPSTDIVSDVTFKEDDFFVEKLNDTTMVLRPKYANMKETLGYCFGDEGGLMYRDAGMVRTSKRPATGIYALSLYDLFYDRVNCVMITVGCDRRSLTKFWFDFGFKTDNVEEFIKVVPQYKRGQTVPPKILYITDSFFNYERIMTSNLVFKFEFTGQATINVDFYGTPVTTTLRPTTTTTTLRTRRTHATHLESTTLNYYLISTKGRYDPSRYSWKRRKMYRTKKLIESKIRYD